jgi:hypothetical protein
LEENEVDSVTSIISTACNIWPLLNLCSSWVLEMSAKSNITFPYELMEMIRVGGNAASVII